MIRLAGKFKTKFSFEENQITGRLTACLPTAFSLLREASRDVMDMTASVFDARTRGADLGAA
jgi:preprotein translocase subunit SecA